MKQNIDYYPHYTGSDQHSKFKMLRVEYGWEGEGKFWALNNRIAMADKCCLDISKKYNKAAIASDLNFNIADFDKFIHFLIHECELLIECQGGVITTDIIQETFKKVMRERGEARARYRRTSKEKQKTSGEKKETSCEAQEKQGRKNTQRKVKESKVKEKEKKKNSKKKKSFDVFGFRPGWFPEKDWHDLVEHRRTLKTKPTESERAYSALIKQFKIAVDSGFDISECVDIMVQRCWTGFQAEWVENIKNKNGKNNNKTSGYIEPEVRDENYYRS